jgi:hypothetical protein
MRSERIFPLGLLALVTSCGGGTAGSGGHDAAAGTGAAGTGAAGTGAAGTGAAGTGAAGKGAAGTGAAGTGAAGTGVAGTGAAGNGAAGAGGGVTGAGGAPAHAPNPKLAAIAAGSALDLGRFTCTAPDGEDPSSCRALTDYSGFAYDPRNHQMLAFGGGHATTMTDSVVALVLGGDLSWQSLYVPTPCNMMGPTNLDATLGAWKAGAGGPYPRPVSAHTYDFHGVAPEQNEFILLGRSFTGGGCSQVGNDVGGPIAHFDLAKQTWSFSTDAGTSKFTDGLAATALDPVTRKFVSLGTAGLSLYDPAKRTMQHVADTLPSAAGKAVSSDSLGYANHMVYFPPLDTFYYFLRGATVATYALKLDRASLAQSTLDAVTTQGPSSPHQEPAYDYDSTNQLIGGGVSSSTFYAFNPASKTWSSQAITGGKPGTLAFHALRYDPVDNVFIFITDYASGQHTWAYRYK